MNILTCITRSKMKEAGRPITVKIRPRLSSIHRINLLLREYFIFSDESMIFIFLNISIIGMNWWCRYYNLAILSMSSNEKLGSELIDFCLSSCVYFQIRLKVHKTIEGFWTLHCWCEVWTILRVNIQWNFLQIIKITVYNLIKKFLNFKMFWQALFGHTSQHTQPILPILADFFCLCTTALYVWFSQFYWHFKVLNRKTGY